ncbi:MAG: redoxin domain-containing protein [Thermoflexus sp.]|jgi:peroxiredoxin|nr:redoxin domain-containing protein [Thermoflexus sp.]
MNALPIGDPAPRIFGSTSDRKPCSKNPQEARHILLVTFCKKSCAASRRILHGLERSPRAYHTDCWRMMGIWQDLPQSLREIAQKFQISFPPIANRDFETSRAYRLTHAPILFPISPRGWIQRILIRFHWEELEGLFRSLERSLDRGPWPIIQGEDPSL